MQASGLPTAHSIMYSVSTKLHLSSRYQIDGVSKRAFVKRKTFVDKTDWNRHKAFVGEFSGKRDLSGDCIFTRLQNRSARDSLGAIVHFSTHASDSRAAANRPTTASGRIGSSRLSHLAHERNSSG